MKPTGIIRPKAIDVFCGCGGTSLGLKNAGFNVIAGVEVRDSAAAAYKLNHPNSALFFDVRLLTGSMLFDSLGLTRGELDLLSGCPPCQGFSSMRTLNTSSASKDERNDLIFEFIRLVKEILPKAVLMENVRGLSKNWRFTIIKRELRKLGYDVQYSILNSENFGVPQRRRRLVMCATRTGRSIETVYTLPIKKKNVRDAIGSLPHPRDSANRLHKMLSQHSAEIRQKIALIPKNGGSRKDLGKSAQLKCHRGKNMGFSDVYGRMAWDAPAPTITRYSNNPSKGRFLHPVQNRGISILEAALLQSFPKNYKFPKDARITEIASMIGEAFPPKMAKIIAKRIIESLND